MWILFTLLSAASWAMVNVLDSSLTKRYAKPTVIFMGVQALFSLSFLVLIGIFLPVSTTWHLPLLAVGICSYFGDFFLFYVLKRIEVSVVNIAWAFQSIFISLAAFAFFHEHWSLMQTIGVVCIMTSSFLIAFWHTHVSLGRTVGLLLFLGLITAPNYLVQKAALLDSQTIIAVFFWSIIGRECMSFAMPWLFPAYRSKMLATLRTERRVFFLFNAAVIAVWFLAILFFVYAYEAGPASLVSMLANTQPFFVMFFAWLFHRCAPAFAAHEGFGAKSLGIKALGFAITFFGLALLALS
ncbi:MAG: DMT family transporter [Candidatus Peribacteraceae bacterium]|nr:DMT family transporter [Candidatus Peribacteraceae bacterium]